MLAGSIAVFVAAFAISPAQAQSSSRPSITVAATIAAEPASQTVLAIGVGPPNALPRNSFVRVRGLPPMVALSEGHAIAPGAWAVSLAALPNLKMMLPPGAAGRSEVVITLVAVDGSVLAEAKSMLAISAHSSDKARGTQRDAAPPAGASILRAGTPLQAPPAAIGVPPAKASLGPISPHDRERALRLMQKAEAQLQDGAVSPARLLYERAADIGLPEAAMALAATYDKAEMERLKLQGVAPDPKEARRWYEHARKLGAKGAEERLRQIGAK